MDEWLVARTEPVAREVEVRSQAHRQYNKVLKKLPSSFEIPVLSVT
ncbi:hypothetical protein FHW37_11124 [Neorhizobium alkalisoli]|uniref:Uncharacterized protein n=1 Tax=Neorhizobium alkalisoli TaxID=528178 RepID=A0A561QAY3_9HYPH|nr:hypothetical protein FHW37_11124 [Neorhizobium alkalisoli]